MQLLLTPNLQPDLGLVILKPGNELLKLFNQHRRVLISPAPFALDATPSGILNASTQPLLNDKAVIRFLNHERVMKSAGGKKGLAFWLKQNYARCQCENSDDDYHHPELTVTYRKTGAIRTCWNHDNLIRPSHDEKYEALARHNYYLWLVDFIRCTLEIDHPHLLNRSDLFTFAVRRGLTDLLPESIVCWVLGRKVPEPIKGVMSEHSIVWQDKSEAQMLAEVIEQIKQVIKVTIDEAPPASFLKIPKLKRWENVKWLRWVKSQPCCVCAQQADDPHHIIGHGLGGMGTKTHDMFTLPLCRHHHNALHHDMQAWEREHGSQIVLLFQFLNRSFGIGAFG